MKQRRASRAARAGGSETRSHTDVCRIEIAPSDRAGRKARELGHGQRFQRRQLEQTQGGGGVRSSSLGDRPGALYVVRAQCAAWRPHCAGARRPRVIMVRTSAARSATVDHETAGVGRRMLLGGVRGREAMPSRWPSAPAGPWRCGSASGAPGVEPRSSSPSAAPGRAGLYPRPKPSRLEPARRGPPASRSRPAEQRRRRRAGREAGADDRLAVHDTARSPHGPPPSGQRAPCVLGSTSGRTASMSAPSPRAGRPQP